MSRNFEKIEMACSTTISQAYCLFTMMTALGVPLSLMVDSSLLFPNWISTSANSSYLSSLSFFIIFCVLITSGFNKNSKTLMGVLTFLLPTLLFFFNTNSFFLFFVFFEASLVPVMYLIMIQGYQPERVKAVFYFVMYTVICSLPMLFFILYLNTSFQSVSILLLTSVKTNFSSLMMASALLGLVAKLPIWGFHLWLPKAHVEAPVSGSMLLAALLLKLGGFGLIVMMSITSFSFEASLMSFFKSMSLMGIIIVSLMILTVVDAKKLIAYSSVIHMNMLVPACFWKLIMSNSGVMLTMISHGFVSAGLFCSLNIVFLKVNSRSGLDFKGFVSAYAGWIFMFLPFCLFNMALPPTMSFWSELSLILPSLSVSLVPFFFFIVSMFLSALYNMSLFTFFLGSKVKAKAFSNFVSSDFLVMSLMMLPLILQVQEALIL